MKIDTTDQFEKDLKRLSKKFSSLSKDLEVLKVYGIELFHEKKSSIDIVQIPGFSDDRFKIYKVRSIACRALKNKGKHSGLRLIYAYDIENNECIFLELYFKGEKENEDRERIKKFQSDSLQQSLDLN